MMKIAGAPISWGVCEVPGWGRVLEPERVLGEMASLGLTATELGPPDYLPADPEALRALLAEHNLSLVAGFLAVVLHDPPRVPSTVEEAERVAALLAAGGAEVLVLAAATGLEGYDERPDLTVEQWRTLIQTSAKISDIAARHGLRTVLHPHVGTHVERAAEVERFLADSELKLCLDTGHLLIGGADPVDLVRRHPDRVGHVHLKDVRADIAAKVRGGQVGYTAAVQEGIYVPLGDGDVDIEELVELVQEAGYTGWFVLEQDTALGDGGPADTPVLDTARSLAHLNKITGKG
ncbi:inosose dehydratase [Umezawaea tangerina]|uniref:Inosose dehydratase n=2 Tax=Umezawaea tangerina TaxID=84725 RepID=A0A2T0SH51_9PSEU|nr:TIM barrel protein [Umezawaea tangerina]PRY32727.1 inosose dehydratase [Umezawaea tangerina]